MFCPNCGTANVHETSPCPTCHPIAPASPVTATMQSGTVPASPPGPETSSDKIVITFDEPAGSEPVMSAPTTMSSPAVAALPAWSPVVAPSPLPAPLAPGFAQPSLFALKPGPVPYEPIGWVLPGVVALEALLVLVLAFTGDPMLNPIRVLTLGSDQRGSVTLAIAVYLAVTVYALLRDRVVGRYLLRVGAALALPIAAMPIVASILSVSNIDAYFFYGFQRSGSAASYQPVLFVLLALALIGALVLDGLLPMTTGERSEAAPTAAVWVTRFLGIVSIYMGALTVESIVYVGARYHSWNYSHTGIQDPYVDAVISLGLGIGLVALSPALRRGSRGARTGVLWVSGALGLFIFLGTGFFNVSQLLHVPKLWFGLFINGPMLGIIAGCVGLFVLLLRRASRSLFQRGGNLGVWTAAMAPMTAGVPAAAYAPASVWATAGAPEASGVPQPGAPWPAASVARASGTNGLAIGAFVCGLLGISAVAIVLGFIARNQITRSGGREGGAGLALAGIILGFIWIAISILIFIAVMVAAHQLNSQYPGGP